MLRHCPPKMNYFLIGNADKTERLLQLPDRRFLLFANDEIADAFLAVYPRAVVFDPTIHSFNPLKGLTYQRARQFAATMYTASPEGQNTLTVRNGKRALAKFLLEEKPQRLDKIHIKSKDPALIEVQATIDDLLLSPDLRRIFCTRPNFEFPSGEKWTAPIITRIDQAALGDDAFVLVNLMMSQFKGQLIVPDGGSYLRDIHINLVRENRLTVGLNSLSEVSPTLQQALLTIKDKTAYRTTLEDANRLVTYFPAAHGKPRLITELEGDEYMLS